MSPRAEQATEQPTKAELRRARQRSAAYAALDGKTPEEAGITPDAELDGPDEPRVYTDAELEHARQRLELHGPLPKSYGGGSSGAAEHAAPVDELAEARAVIDALVLGALRPALARLEDAVRAVEDVQAKLAKVNARCDALLARKVELAERVDVEREDADAARLEALLAGKPKPERSDSEREGDALREEFRAVTRDATLLQRSAKQLEEKLAETRRDIRAEHVLMREAIGEQIRTMLRAAVESLAPAFRSLANALLALRDGPGMAHSALLDGLPVRIREQGLAVELPRSDWREVSHWYEQALEAVRAGVQANEEQEATPADTNPENEPS